MESILEMPKAWEFNNAKEFSESCQEFRNSKQFKQNFKSVKTLNEDIKSLVLTGDENYEGVSLFEGNMKDLLDDIYR